MSDSKENELERLRSEVTSLKLELATLTSAIRELQHQQSGHRLSIPSKAIAPEARRPSLVPAAVVVMLASALLSWQVAVTPRDEGSSTAAGNRDPGSGIRNTPIPDTGSRISMKIAEEPPVTPVDFAQGKPLVKPTVYKGALTVRADKPGATVFVNRRNVGAAPVRVDNLRAGAHLVWVESDGYRRWTRVVTVPAEKVTRVTADLEPAPEPVIER